MDERQIAETVAEINRLYVKADLDKAMAIGRLVLERFYNNDPARLHCKGKKTMALRQVAEHPDLLCSTTYLYRCVAVLEQMEILPPEIGSALTISTHSVLLGVHDADTKLHLATLAVEKGLSVRELEIAVKSARHSASGMRGRPRLPAFVRAVVPLMAARKLTFSEEITPEMFAIYDPEKAEATLKKMRGCLAEMQEQADQVAVALEAWRRLNAN